MDQLYNAWAKTLDIYSKKCDDKVIYDSYFAPLQLKQVHNEDVIITTLYDFNLQTILPERKTLENIFREVTGKNYFITLITEDEWLSRQPKKEEYDYADNLNSDMTFETFVVGSSNRIAQNASLAVATKPGTSYNPLFIHSIPGLGKTHLLNAIGNYVKSHNSNAKVLYTTSEDFLNKYIEHLQANTMDQFNKIFRQIDVLLIDDIQFLAAKKSSSEALFNIFNELKRYKKQIVITSDKHPKELKGMEGRLVSRFMQGLTVSIDTPEFETAKAILLKKIEIENIDFPIDEEVIDFIASHFNGDVRELEGSLNTLLFHKINFASNIDHIDLECALDAFQDTYQITKEANANKEITVDLIKKTVAEYYNLTVSQINSKSRTSNVTVARHIAMYLVRTLVDGISYIQIGYEFGGRDHSTVMKAYDKVSKKVKKDDNYRKAIEEIKSRLT